MILGLIMGSSLKILSWGKEQLGLMIDSGDERAAIK
jgi:hypothetical protein